MKTKEIIWDKQALVAFKDEACCLLTEVWGKTYWRFTANNETQPITNEAHLCEIKGLIEQFYTDWGISGIS